MRSCTRSICSVFRVAPSEKNGRNILDTLIFCYILTCNILKEGISVLSLILTTAVAILLATESEIYRQISRI